MSLPDHILIVGLGKSGVALAKFLHGTGRKIAITDAKTREALAPSLKELEGIQFEGFFGGHEGDFLASYPFVVVSPGVDSRLPFLMGARDKGIPVIGEIELAARFTREPIIAVTGTNGKTTTTTLLGDIFSRAFKEVFVGGNIGNPFINYLTAKEKGSYVILEVSSFQLETVETFRPQTALLLNLAEDHLDRYGSYKEYIEAKYRIFENQSSSDFAVLRSGLAHEGLKAHKLFFSSTGPVEEGAFLEGDLMKVRVKGKEFLYKRSLSRLVGVHNTENLLAALITAHIYDIDRGIIEAALSQFKGLAHRVEPVREIGGVVFYNDSKATNVDATKRALESMNSKVVLIAGGKDKGGSYRSIAGLKEKLRAMVLIGEAKERIAREIGDITQVYMETDMQGAVERALAIARKGDGVLFSPMCSSFDMFRDYKERGNIFKGIVESL